MAERLKTRRGQRGTVNAVLEYRRERAVLSSRSSAGPRSPIPTASGPSPTTSPAPAGPGDDVVAVVSAMGKTTDDLVRLANDVAKAPGGREMDMLLTAGERISMALLCMAVEALGVPAVSFTGSQAGIVTDTDHGKAKIIEVKADRIREALDAGRVAIVAGFQGVSTSRDITTLGPRRLRHDRGRARGGARRRRLRDLHRRRGCLQRRPAHRSRPRASSRHVSFDEMLEMAATGGRVLALRSVEFARNHGVQIHVRSSFTWAPGTWVTEEGRVDGAGDHLGCHARHLRGEDHDRAGARPARCRGDVFRTLAEAGVNVDMIVQNVSTAGHTDISFTLPRDDLARASVEMDKIVVETEAAGFRTDEQVGRVSLVGAGMKTHPGVAAKMFETLATEGINIEMISTSTIRISCVVAEDDVERAVQALHTAFELEREVRA